MVYQKLDIKAWVNSIRTDIVSHMRRYFCMLMSTIGFLIPTLALAVTDDDSIADTEPNFLLDAGHAALKLAYGMCRGLCESLVSIGTDALNTISTNTLFNSDFKTGTFKDFYNIAYEINAHGVTKIALVILAAAFVMAMLRISENSNNAHVPLWKNQMVQTTIMYGVSAYVISRSLDIAAGIYWISQQATNLTFKALQTIGVSQTTSIALGDTVKNAFMNQIDGITYRHFGDMFIYVLVALVFILVTVGCFCYIVSVGLLRMAELYLRAAYAPIPCAFAVSDKTRHTAWNYLKGFSALCFQAGIILAALTFAPLFITVAGACVKTPEDATSIGSIIALVIAPCVALGCVTGIVKKSESISRAIFGL